MQTQFDGICGDRMKEVYGDFCSKQADAAQLYKEILKSDRKFLEFVKVCYRLKGIYTVDKYMTGYII